MTKTGYVMAHFSKWIRPGFHRIASADAPSISGIYTTAYQKNSNLVIVCINLRSSTASQTFDFSNITISGINTYTTTSSSDLDSESVDVSGSSFSVSLPARSITTLVSY